ncbi:MAG: RDD family protein [Bdellovibrionota bacterium]
MSSTETSLSGSLSGDSEMIKYAGFWLRFLANVIDSILLNIASWIIELMILGAIYWLKVIAGSAVPVASFFEVVDALMIQIINVGIYLAITTPYYVVGQHKYSTTIGKRMLNVYVVSAADKQRITLKQSVARYCSYLLSYLPFCAGYIMAAFHPEKRALHDIITGTVVIVKPRQKRDSDLPAAEITSAN